MTNCAKTLNGSGFSKLPESTTGMDLMKQDNSETKLPNDVKVEVLPYMGKPPLNKYEKAKRDYVPPTVFTNGTKVIQPKIEDEE